MRVLYPTFQVRRLVGKLTGDVAMARDSFVTGAERTARTDNTGNRVAAATTKTIEVLAAGGRISACRNYAGPSPQAARIKGTKQILRRILSLSMEGSRVGDAVTLAQPFGE
jgi:hypothetical protein